MTTVETKGRLVVPHRKWARLAWGDGAIETELRTEENIWRAGDIITIDDWQGIGEPIAAVVCDVTSHGPSHYVSTLMLRIHEEVAS